LIIYMKLLLYHIALQALLIQRGRQQSRFRSCAHYDTENNVPFSIDHRPEHPISHHAAIPDTMRSLSMRSRGNLDTGRGRK